MGRNWMSVHLSVHGWSDEDWDVGVPCTEDVTQKVIAKSVGNFCEGVCRGWGNQEQVCPSSQLDMQYRITEFMPCLLSLVIGPDWIEYFPIILILPDLYAQFGPEHLDIKEMFCSLRNNDLYLHVLMSQQALDDQGNLDAGHGTGGADEDMFLSILILIDLHLLGLAEI